MADPNTWMALVARLDAKAALIFNGAEVPLTEEGPRDPRVVALTLLARSLSNTRAAVLLIEHGQIVEARTIVRCVHENFFWLAALVKQGAGFIRAMELDDVANRRKRANGLLDWAKAQAEKSDFEQPLTAFRDGLANQHGKTEAIVMKQAADVGGVGEGFVVYRELSTDAAHPSAASLSRHLSIPDSETAPPFILHADPIVDPMESIDTLELLCSGLLCVLVAANEAVGGAPGGERLDSLSRDFRDLSASNKADRDRITEFP